MFCSKCGKEILDEAVICPNCGCATKNLNSRTDHSGHSENYHKLVEYKNNAKSVFVLGILSLVLSMGIGFIFMIINYVKILSMKKITEADINPQTNAEVAEFKEAEKKFKTGSALTAIGMGIFFVLLFIIIVSAQM